MHAYKRIASFRIISQRFYNYIIWYKKSCCILYDIVLLPVKFQDVCDTRITPDQNDQ